MQRSAIALAAVAAVLSAAPARAAPDGQFDLHGGGECTQRCEWDLVLGANAFWRAKKLFALGGMFEWVNTAGDRRTNTLRYGPAFRLYPTRGTLFEPYLHFALGPASFEHDGTGCETQHLVFLQGGLGLELRVLRHGYVGLALTGTQQGGSRNCYEVFGTPEERAWKDTATYAVMLSVRFGPFGDAD